MAKLDIIIGPMFAGKSTFLIKQIRLLKILNKKYLVVKPSIDIRYNLDNIVSHNMESEQCISLELLKDIFNYELNEIDTIFIDEAQFFQDLKETVLILLEKYYKNIYIVGLDGDFNRNKFGQILDLIPYSDSCEKIQSLCKICLDGTRGIFTKRLNNNNSQNLIGSSDLYMSVCREHYLQDYA